MRFLVGVHISDNDIAYQPWYEDILCDLRIKNRIELNKVEVAKPKELGEEKTDYKNFLSKHFTVNATENSK